jgi:predicted DCC family thiol-disulfide oxidoreductase YuxK
MESSTARFEVFFDGQCPLCRREMEMVRRKDKDDLLILTDIAADDFVNAEIPMETLMREIHGRHADGTYVKGVEVFRQIYDRLGFGFLVKPSRLPILRPLLDGVYRLFAYFRYKHAMHRMRNARCGTDTCQVSGSSSPSGENEARNTTTSLNQSIPLASDSVAQQQGNL